VPEIITFFSIADQQMVKKSSRNLFYEPFLTIH